MKLPETDIKISIIALMQKRNNIILWQNNEKNAIFRFAEKRFSFVIFFSISIAKHFVDLN